MNDGIFIKITMFLQYLKKIYVPIKKNVKKSITETHYVYQI